ncbi:ImmA/IrrE family metallo-endopeptidase [Staphylococcus sp. 18_1_E_LY]|uniref:ImmA/IrrE family metallo-endopeptidase n=1 Tax=Staphylococcus lloydii TaxID=2781774 RepID=A0A7T1AZ78_9STAP|nr:ImmA/IrrE family metallo-endopeptidase [Staphylococcus lloydii]MBF7019256.1 ImmA/IrrE family metallo-endopeptidase [Staphylococcus lloydii]MBF7026984.1 ImmA/IrrE family metallo-endopeptidase [Staphylococcus lloydii]QPM74631.1 ImmA/IrrE family metallo-endopeptidase [Staphylococcus lloydii]
MGLYEDLCMEYSHIYIKETNNLPSFQSGSCVNKEIFIRPNLSETHKAEILAEELAHHKLTYGNILDQSQFNNRKFEGYARRYAMEKMISLQDLVSAFKHGCHNLYTMANFFELTEGYVQDCIAHYKRKYGLATHCGNYVIQFEPLRVFEYKTIE